MRQHNCHVILSCEVTVIKLLKERHIPNKRNVSSRLRKRFMKPSDAGIWRITDDRQAMKEIQGTFIVNRGCEINR